jgi:outer membrane murein-binding lipoprotein Lpp
VKLWNILCILLFIIGIILCLDRCQKDYADIPDRRVDSLLTQIKTLSTKVDSLNFQKSILKSQEKTIHEEYNQMVERILLAPDSSQYLITDELIRENRRLDSL